MKVAEPGQTLGDDEARLEAVRDALGPAAGSASTPTAAGTSTRRSGRSALLDRAAGGLEYVEQPCASVEELAAVRRAGRRADRGRRVDPPGRRPLPGARPRGRRHRGAQGAAAGRRARLPADRRGHRPARRRLVSALETSVGIAAGVALAAALPELPYACGLATVQLLTDDVVADPLLPVDGMLPVGVPARGPGRAGRGWPRPRTGWRTGRPGSPQVRGRCGRIGRS